MPQSAGVLECQSARVPECWSAGVPECWSAGVLECWSARVPSARVLEWWMVNLEDGKRPEGTKK